MTLLSGEKAMRCPNCGKKFATRAAVEAHVRDFHKGRRPGKKYLAAQARRWQAAEAEEQSIADLLIEAQIALEEGRPVPSWITDMLP